MGYNTAFQLKVDGIKAEEIFKKAEELLGEDNGVLGMEVYKEDTYTSMGAYGKWYDCQSEIEVLSTGFPGVLFTLSGEGEENGDLWKAYFKDGKSVTYKAEITYPEFKEEDLS